MIYMRIIISHYFTVVIIAKFKSSAAILKPLKNMTSTIFKVLAILPTLTVRAYVKTKP